MALDSITLYHLIRELEPLIIGTRIDKIQQPEKEEVHLLLRSAGRNFRLLLNAGSTAARIHLTEKSKDNPVSPPMFCMILRKHLESGKITGIRQIGLERIVKITIQNYNERGDLQDYYLLLEIMGKHSNLILVDPQTNTILDGLRRYSHVLSRHREVLPGKPYIAPPSQNKIEPIANEEQWISHLLQYNFNRKVSEALLDLFNGLSPELAREIALRAGLEPDAILDTCGEIDLSRLFQAYAHFLLQKDSAVLNPCVYYQSPKQSNLPLAFTFEPYEQYLGLARQQTQTLNEAVNLFYEAKTNYNNTEAIRGSLSKVINEHLNQVSKKCQIYESALTKAAKGLGYQKYGELLTANLYKLSPGMKEITVEDYTDPDFKPLTIALEPNLNGIENAQRYFKLYNKAKSTIRNTEPMLEAAREEIAYLQSLALSIEQAATNQELKEIHQELIDQGYISGKHARRKGLAELATKKTSPSKASAKRKEQDKQSRPHVYFSKTGCPIIVGRNNRQNDRLTWREAKPTDLWLHVKNIPGSHVIVPLGDKQEFPDDSTLEDAATLAAYFSQARGSSQIPVDYTHVKHIKKPRGAKPGMVVYDQHWSLVITPTKENIERLLATEETE
ncbi:MAG TPA: fibronectin/fibrinogen-binding protein [Peptococcaceae bacterium]|nr:fibronectin/fibrinogen-binding protein [Peptococcaceae bacterium]